MSYFPTLNTGGIITSRYAPLCSHWFICSLIKVLSYLNLNILFKLMCSIHFCGRQYWWKYDCTLSWFLVNWKISVQVTSVLKHAVLLHSVALCTPPSKLYSFTDVHKDPDYERRVQDYTAAFQGMDNDGDGTITFEVSLQLQADGRLHFLSTWSWRRASRVMVPSPYYYVLVLFG